MALKDRGKRWHQQQIAQFRKVRKPYHRYENFLEKVLKLACKEYAPQAIVDSRTKTLPSFAEKAIRKLPKSDAIQDLTNPSLALIHAVGMGARLYTIMGVEANSRQFFPDATTSAEQKVHGGVFTVRRGVANTASLVGTGLGYQMDRLLDE